jgi:HEAT repeat protein
MHSFYKRRITCNIFVDIIFFPALGFLFSVFFINCAPKIDLRDDTYDRSMYVIQHSPYWDRRADAAKKLGEYSDARSLEILHAALKDSSSRVQMAVLESLKKRTQEKSIPLIIKYIRTKDTLIRTEAYQALCSYKKKEHVKYYIKASKDKDWFIRVISLRCFRNLAGEVDEKRGFIRSLYLSLDPVLEVQRNALDMLVWYNEPKAIPFLLKISRRRNLTKHSRIILMEAMAHFLPNESVKRRFERLSHSKSHPIRWKARKILREY